MLAEERHQRIIDLLSEHHSINIHMLREILAVSEATVRNDLRYLEEQNKLRRTHGGAISIARNPEIAYDQRAAVNTIPKQKIGRAASQIIRPGETVFLDAGSTVMELARQMPASFEFNVVTAALNTATVAGIHPNVSVHLVGGMLRSSLQELVGPKAVEGIREIHAHKVFLGVSGVDLLKGLTENHIFSAEIKKAMVESSNEVIVLADSSKMGKVFFAELIPLSSVTTLITDKGIGDDYRSDLEKMGVQVIIA